MFIDAFNMMMSAFYSCLDWFGSIIINTGDNGRPFLTFFVGVFVAYTFVRLFLVNFIGSVSGDVTDSAKEGVYKRMSGRAKGKEK